MQHRSIALDETPFCNSLDRIARNSRKTKAFVLVALCLALNFESLPRQRLRRTAAWEPGMASSFLLVSRTPVSPVPQFKGSSTSLFPSHPSHEPFVMARSLPVKTGARSIIEAPYEELSTLMAGPGKAFAIWNALREGNNPLEAGLDPMDVRQSKVLSSKGRDILRSVLAGRRVPKGGETDGSLLVPYAYMLVPCAVRFETHDKDGTRKYLSTLHDGNKIESVLIPNQKFNRTTLCVSTQVGCDRGCRFCATAKMGLIRNLTATEIIAQVIRGLQISKRESMPILSNIVFMGMGDAGRNPVEVGSAVRCITDRKRLFFDQHKVTLSTVGPAPGDFQALADLPGDLAWSLHTADNDLRKRLVPSTQHKTEQLRDGLISALASRPKSKRQLLIAVTLIHDVNDSDEDAYRLAVFLRPFLEVVRKLVVDLIPYNDINVQGFSPPTQDRVSRFMRLLRNEGYFVSVRNPRGDNENAACGMLKTKREKRR